MKNILSSVLPGKNLQAMGIFMEMIVELGRIGQNLPAVQTRYSARIAIVKEFINKNFQHGPSMDELASQACMSPRNFFRIFRQETGQTVGEYIKTLRLQKAYTLLMGTELPIAEIAWKCGFIHSNHFCRFFKSINNCTPVEFRNRQKHNENPPKE